MAKPHLKLVDPTTENRTVTPKRAKNSELRTREYLTEHEIEALMAAARQNRYGHRDATMIWSPFGMDCGLQRSGPALGSGRFQSRHPACPKGQTGHAQRHPLAERKCARCDGYSARARPSPIRVHDRAGCALHHGGLCPDDGAGSEVRRPRHKGPSAHAPACLRICPSQRRPRHARPASIPRAQEYSAHRPLHRIGTRPFQEFLEGLEFLPSQLVTVHGNISNV